MNKELLQKFLEKKGQIVTVDIEKPLKLRKGVAGQLIKRETKQARVGVDYSNIKEVKSSGREIGKLPYGEWEHFKYTILHNNRRQYRFSRLNDKIAAKRYFFNNKEISEEKAKELALASEFRENPATVFNVKEENIKEIRGI